MPKMYTLVNDNLQYYYTLALLSAPSTRLYLFAPLHIVSAYIENFAVFTLIYINHRVHSVINQIIIMTRDALQTLLLPYLYFSIITIKHTYKIVQNLDTL